MTLKSGVYFVHYDDIPKFVETAKAQGRQFCGDYEQITKEIYKDTYRPFSIDKDSDRMSYWSTRSLDWSTCSLEDMKDWDDWDYTERYIELWKPRKVIL